MTRYLAVFLLSISVTTAQQQFSKALGVVEAVDPANGQITLHTDAGATLKIVPQTGARFVRLPLGETNLTKAVPITAIDIDAGDRLLARGQLSDDKSSLAATLLVVMTKADLAKKHEADQAEWQKRGAGGLVSAVNPVAGEVTINTRTAEGTKPLIIVAGAKTVVRRYAPDSVKFADAKPSTVAEINPGDQVRALGEKSADGTHYTAEELVSGSFRNLAATVVMSDPATNTLKVTDLITKKPLLVHVNADSTLRKLPATVAQMIAMRNGGGAGAGGQGGANAAPPAGGGSRAAAPGGAGGPGGPPGAGGTARSRDLQQMIDRLPPLKLDDLKPGDAIIVASTQGADPGQVTAITLLAGVEPILSAASAGGRAAGAQGSWNLDLNMGGLQ